MNNARFFRLYPSASLADLLSRCIWLLVMIMPIVAQAQLAAFSFDGAAGNEPAFEPDFQPERAKVGPFRRGPGLIPDTATGAFNAHGWPKGRTIDPDRYYSFTVTPAKGMAVKLEKLVFDSRASRIGTHEWTVRCSLDGFERDARLVWAGRDGDFRRDQTVHFPDELPLVDGPVEVRIYGLNADDSGGAWRVDNVRLFAAVRPAPPRIFITSSTTFHWEGMDGGAYDVEASLDLSGWFFVARVRSETSRFTFSNRPRGAQVRFYRVRLVE